MMLADVFRYLAVYREGGVYLDVKSTVTCPLDEVLSPDDWAVFEPMTVENTELKAAYPEAGRPEAFGPVPMWQWE